MIKIHHFTSIVILFFAMIYLSGCQCALAKSECPSFSLLFDLRSNGKSLFFGSDPSVDIDVLSLEPDQNKIDSPILIADKNAGIFRTEIFQSATYRIMLADEEQGLLTIVIDNERVRCCDNTEGIVSVSFEGDNLCEGLGCGQFGVVVNL